MDSEEECLLDAGISQSLIPVTQMPTVTQDQEEEGLSEISTAISGRPNLFSFNCIYQLDLVKNNYVITNT